MTEILSYFPGQQVTIFLETLDGYGQRVDGATVPMVTRVILPGYTLAVGYPQNMNRLDVGLFTFQFTLPTGAVSIGSYLIDVAYISPINGFVNTQMYQVVVTAPFGQYSIGTVG